MKIGQKRAARRSLSPNLLWFLSALVVFAIGVALGERGLAQLLGEYWTDATANLLSTGASRPLPTLVVDMSFDAYNVVLDQRQEALAAGVFIAAESDFQPATIRLTDAEIPVRLRLRQGPAVHLGEDDKWNFDVRTRDDELLLGMQRFYLLDPADNNWLNERAFQRNLAREELLSTRYRFVRLIFNGDDRGIYALQEGFGPELITSQGRPEGVIVEFDATRLWQSIAYYEGEVANAIDDPITNLSADDFQFFEVDTFRDASIARDELLSAQKDRAIGLLRGLQNGELSAAEVFDVEKYGRFLAVVDLWGAIDGTSLFNLRYYYNPENDRLEPVGFNGNPLSDGERISLAATYQDPDLQAAYARSAERMIEPAYLDQLQSTLDAELEQLQRALQSELFVPIPWDRLSERQSQIQRSLHPIQPVFATLGPPELTISATIQIDVANVLNLPVEILGFDIDGATFMDADPGWIQGDPGALLVPDREGIVLRAFPREETAVLRHVRFHLPLTEIIKVDKELDFMQEPQIQVATRVLGLDRVAMTTARPGYSDPLLVPAVPGAKDGGD